MRNKTWLWIIGVPLLAVAGFFLWTWFALGNDNASNMSDQQQNTTSFEECVAAGHPVMESHPRQCSADGQTFTEELPEDETPPEIPQEGEFISEEGVDIEVDIAEGETITSPFEVRGEVPGNWSFEADFPVELLDEEGNTLIETFATLQGDWMTEDMVPFSTELEFPDQPAGSTGTLVLHKSNPSGLPEHDDRLEIDVSF